MSAVTPSGPQGTLALWLKRIANVGFVIAAVYCVYLIALLIINLLVPKMKPVEM